MAKRNITLSLDQRVRGVAAQRGLSISAYLAEELDRASRRDEAYPQAMAIALALMDSAQPRGGQGMGDREALHDRESFVDTNILIYAYDTASETRQLRAAELLLHLWGTSAGVLSTQVLEEFYVNMIRKAMPPMSSAAAREVVRSYATWVHAPSTPATVLRASEIGEANQLSFWDSLIIASAEQQGASIMLTEDLNHGQRIAGLKIINPFINTTWDVE